MHGKAEEAKKMPPEPDGSATRGALAAAASFRI